MERMQPLTVGHFMSLVTTTGEIRPCSIRRIGHRAHVGSLCLGVATKTINLSSRHLISLEDLSYTFGRIIRSSGGTEDTNPN